MKVVYLATGAAGMYCGSCLRDNRLAATLIAQKRDVTLIPLYTPIRTDETAASAPPIYYGGLNVFLKQSLSWYRRLPAWLTGVLDSPALLRWVGRFAGSTSAASLGRLTVSILKGEDDAQRSELQRLIAALRQLHPDLINLPNLMMVGLARPLKAALQVPVLCTLSGEDIFLDDLPEPYRTEARELIRRGAQDVDAFVSVTHYFAGHAAEHFGLPRDRIHVVPLGVSVDDFAEAASPAEGSFNIGYLARMCPAKGLDRLCEAFVALRRQGRNCRLRIAGYAVGSDRRFVDGLRRYLQQSKCEGAVEFLGEVDRPGKIRFYQSLHAFSMPTAYVEAKGVSVLEAMAAGVPVVQPRHGSFPEFIEATGGGLLYDPRGPGGKGGVEPLVEALGTLMDDAELRRRLAAAARRGVREHFNDRLMADRTWALYEQFVPVSAR